MPEWLTIENVISVLTAIVTLAAAIAAITPSEKDNKYIQVVLDLINTLGLNVGKAVNKDDKRS